MWDAANKAKQRLGEDGKNFDQIWNDRLKDVPSIPGNDDDGAEPKHLKTMSQLRDIFETPEPIDGREFPELLEINMEFL